jgi:hypothetical protein
MAFSESTFCFACVQSRVGLLVLIDVDDAIAVLVVFLPTTKIKPRNDGGIPTSSPNFNSLNEGDLCTHTYSARGRGNPTSC